MSSSYLNWLSPTAILFALAGCSAPAGQWTTVPAADNGGFTIMFPVEGGLQDGSLQLGQETIPSHVNIVADSGITYVSGWFTLTESMLRIPEDHLLDSIWQIMPAQGAARPTDGPEILSSPDRDTRNGWFMSGDGVRLGVVLHKWDDRISILSVGTPESNFGAGEHRNMVRYLRSFKLNSR